MANLDVIASYQFQENELVTVDKLNLMATPVVNLALETPVNDQNYFRNGNFYSSFWANAAGVSCPVGVETVNADYWSVNPNGAAVNSLRSTSVPDLFSLFSLQIVGAASVTDVSVGQTISADLSATLRRPCTFSGYIENNSGANVSPVLEIWTADAFNNFNAVTKQTTVNLQTCPTGAWTYCTATEDLTSIPNAGNGLLIKVLFPSGALSSNAKSINCSRLKFQIGELATEFSDDPSLFIQTTSVDSTMLQDGCLARSSLYVTNPGVIPEGAFAPGAIQGTDIGVGQIEAINLDPGISTTTTAAFTTPAVNASVAVTLTSAAKISAGLELNIAGAGEYQTVSVAGNVVTATNIGSAGNAAPGTLIASGATVTTAGNAVTGCLGYTPINKAGDTEIGTCQFTNDLSLTGSIDVAGVVIGSTYANESNDNFMPAISFDRVVKGRAIGLETTGRFKTLDNSGGIGYLLDTVTGVDTASYQNGSITLAKLAQSLINIVIPAGMVRMFAGPNPPSGWLLCDGTAYPVSTYPGLYAAIGTYWGAGSGGQQFQVPDFRGRSPLGYVNTAVSGITGRAFASRGGEENHTLTTAELASHTHPITDQQHIHAASDSGHTHTDAGHTHAAVVGTINTGTSGSGQNISANVAQTAVGYANIQTGHANITTDYRYTGITTTNANGSNGAHNNMSPYSVLYFIIKT